MEEEFWRTQREVGDSHLGLIHGLLDHPDLAGPRMQHVRQKLETVRDWLTQDRSAARRATRRRAFGAALRLATLPAAVRFAVL